MPPRLPSAQHLHLIHVIRAVADETSPCGISAEAEARRSMSGVGFRPRRGRSRACLPLRHSRPRHGPKVRRGMNPWEAWGRSCCRRSAEAGARRSMSGMGFRPRRGRSRACLPLRHSGPRAGIHPLRCWDDSRVRPPLPPPVIPVPRHGPKVRRGVNPREA